MARILWRPRAWFWVILGATSFPIGTLIIRDLSTKSLTIALVSIPFGALTGYLSWGYAANITPSAEHESPEESVRQPSERASTLADYRWIVGGAITFAIGALLIPREISVDSAIFVLLCIPAGAFTALCVRAYLQKLSRR